MRTLVTSAMLVVLVGLAAQGGTMSASPQPPAVVGSDMANYGAVTGTDKWWAENNATTGGAKGQTFRTGIGAARLKAITYQIADGQQATATKRYVVRVGTIVGTNFTPVYAEGFIQDFTWNAGEYMTWTFTNPPLLSGETLYGVDVGLTNSSSAWQTGIPYLNYTDSEYADGQFYTSGTGQAGVGSGGVVLSLNRDRIFHLDFEPPGGPGFEFVAGDPPDNATNALLRSQLVATFNQNLRPGTGNIIIRDLTNGTAANLPVDSPAITLSGNLLMIATAGALDWNRSYAICIEPGALQSDGGTNFAGIADDTTWNFTTASGDPLILALQTMKDHVTGLTNLTASQIAAFSQTIDTEAYRFADSANTITSVFNLVRSFDQVKGPLWLATATGGLTRSAATNDLNWTIYRAMQAIMDRVFTSGVISNYETLIHGFMFGSSSNFPGPCAAPPTNQSYTVAINASFPATFGRDTQGWTLPARRPTGAYLAPGTIATVTVPAALVGTGYKIRVGAHSWDFSNKPTIKRLDRSSLLYSIEAATTKIASPLGGGIYLEVPLGADAGIVDVTITGAARSPLCRATSYHQTTLSEWLNSERTQPGPWADFQTDKFHMQVPRSWIYANTNAPSLLADWDAAMDSINDLMGFPRDRGKETMYLQVDLLLRASVYAPGYPTVNDTYNPTTSYGGNASSYLVRGPQFAPSYCFHEQGHSYFFPKFGGESESTVNLLHVPVWHQNFGYSLDDAFRTSVDYGNFKNVTNAPLDNTAVLWMTSFNFSPRKVAMADWEKSYQPQGHAKFVDIARLYGWDGLGRFWFYYNSNDTYNVSVPEDNDSLLLQLCQSVGQDVRPLFHFWGILPQNPATVAAGVAAAGLTPPVEIYDLLVHYQSLVPTNNAAYQAWCLQWYGKQPTMSGYGVEREHARQWDTNLLVSATEQVRPNGEIFDEAAAAAVRARVQEILDLYYPTGRPTDYSAWAATFVGADLSDPAADLDGDGLSNDEERIWGLNPLDPASHNPIPSVAGLAAGNFAYTRRTAARTGLQFTVWTSTDMKTWTQDTGAGQTPGTPLADVETVLVTLSPALLNEPQLFVRIRAAP